MSMNGKLIPVTQFILVRIVFVMLINAVVPITWAGAGQGGPCVYISVRSCCGKRACTAA